MFDEPVTPEQFEQRLDDGYNDYNDFLDKTPRAVEDYRYLYQLYLDLLENLSRYQY